MTRFPLPPHARQSLLRLRESVSSADLVEREYSADERTSMAKSGEAMGDGSFPIRTIADLHNAVKLWSHSDNPKEARAHIIARAKAMGAEDELPYSWHPKGNSIATSEAASPSAATGTEVELREHVELLEASVVPSDDQKHIVEVTLIRSGTSKNGNHYPPDVLSKAVPLFEGATAFADHASTDTPNRSVRDIVGYYRNVKAITESSGTRLRAQLHLVPGNDWLWHILQETQTNPSLCGVSIDASGVCEEEQGQRTVTALTRVFSVDVVSRPAAGGSIDRLIASEQRRKENIPSMDPKAAVTDPPAPNGSASAGPGTNGRDSGSVPVREGHQTGSSNTTNNVGTGAPSLSTTTTSSNASIDLAALVEQMRQEREAAQRELERLRSVLSPASPQASDPASDLARLAEEIKRERDLSRCEHALTSALAEAQLPDPVVQKIRKQFSGRVFESATLSQTIAEEKEVLSALTAAGQIRGMGYEKPVHVGMSEYDQLQAAFDKLFDIEESEAAKSVPAFAGIREAFAIATGQDIGLIGSADRRLLPQFAEGLQARVRRGNLTEAETLLREADVTTASFSQLLGTSMNKRLLKDYQAWPSEWQKFTTITAIKDFKTQTRVRLGAFGSLSTVSEDAAYTTLTVSDTSATYSPAKRGNLVQVTRETIINDDLYAIKQIPQKLAAAAAFTLAEFVYNLLAPGGGNIYDTHPLFDSVNHLNTGVVAASLGTANSGAGLASAALQAAIIKMRKQTNMAGKPIGLKPRYILTCPDLEFTAMTILRSAGLPGGNNNDINPMMGYCEPIISPQLNSLAAGPASTTIWIAIADPRVIDTLEVGFVGGQANPVLLIQDMPLYGLNFAQDTISYKVRHEYGGAVVDYRGFYLGNN